MSQAPPAAASLGTVRVATVVGFLVFVELTSGIVQGMLPTLIPALGAELKVSAADLNWVASAQLLAAAVSVPLFGRLGDVYGHRRMLRVATVLLAIGSILVAWAPSYAVLLIGRAMQGALAALLPLEMGLVRDRLDPKGAKAAIGLLVGALTFGASAGMVLAGMLSEVMSSVHGVLWIPAAATVACVAVVFFLVPESATRARGGVDFAGAGLLSISLVALLLAVSQGPDWGWTSGATLGLFAAAAVLGIVWVMVELRVPYPVVDIRMTADRSLFPVYVASFVLGAALFGSQTAGALFVAAPSSEVGYGFGYDALGIGWMLVPVGTFAFIGSVLAPRLTSKIGSRSVLGLGGVLMALGYLALVIAHGEPWQFVSGNAVIGLGVGFGLSAMPALVLDASPAERTGIATGIYNTTKTIGGAVAGAVFAALMSAMTIGSTGVPTEGSYQAVWGCCAAICLFITVAAAVTARTRQSAA